MSRHNRLRRQKQSQGTKKPIHVSDLLKSGIEPFFQQDVNDCQGQTPPRCAMCNSLCGLMDMRVRRVNPKPSLTFFLCWGCFHKGRDSDTEPWKEKFNPGRAGQAVWEYAPIGGKLPSETNPEVFSKM